MRYSLFAGCCLLPFLLPALAPPSRVLNLADTARYEGLTTDLDPDRLVRLYRADLHLRQVRPNPHDPGVTDSVMAVATPLDHLDFLKNRHKALLYGATITSGRVSFAGMRVGVPKAQFCRTLHLSPAYDVYAFTDGMENFTQLRFTFAGDKLKSVQYKPLVNLEAID